MTSELTGSGGGAGPSTDDASMPFLPPAVLSSHAPTAPAEPVVGPDFFQVAQQASAMVAADRARRSKRARRRGLIIKLGFVVLLLVGVVVVLNALHDRAESREDAAAGALVEPASQEAMVEAPVAPANPFVVDTSDLHFALPLDAPAEPISLDLNGQHVSGTSWEIDTPKLFMQVIAINFSTPLDEVIAQGSIDADIGTVARGNGGEIVLNEVYTENGIWGRHAVIQLDSGKIFIESRAKGSWVVSFLVTTNRDVAPSVFNATVSSFTFK